jgi:nitroreductase
MDFESVIRRRRSVRKYQQVVPSRAVIDRVVDIARRAPTAGFAQGVDFLMLDDPTAVAEFYAITTHPDRELPEDLLDAQPPVLVVVWSDPQRYLSRYSAADKARFGLQDPDRWAVKFWDIDAAMAAMQLQLAAVNEGLDTWFFGIAHGAAQMRDRFGVPDDRNLIGVIGIGYRTEDEVAFGSGATRPRRPLDEQLHHNGW